MTSNKDIIKGLKQAYQSIKVDPASIERNRATILASYREAFPIQHRDLFFYFRPAFAAIIALFMFVTASSGLIVYAQKTSPGNQLYGLKIAYEKIAPILMSAQQKKVFRIEIVNRRIEDVKNSLGSEKENASSLSLQTATQELEKEINNLKKELNGGEEITIAEGPDSPVMDNQKIIEAINNKDIDLSKILLEAKEAIQNNDLEIASEKLGTLEEIFSVTADEKNQNEQKEETTTSNNQQTTNSTSTTPEITTENLTTPVSTPVIKNINPDFKVDVNIEQETESSQK
jgi:hypothetical protein